jgi:hypothetical protein
VWGGANSRATVVLCWGKATEVLKASCDTDLLLDGPWVSCELVGCSGGVATVVCV